MEDNKDMEYGEEKACEILMDFTEKGGNLPAFLEGSITTLVTAALDFAPDIGCSVGLLTQCLINAMENRQYPVDQDEKCECTCDCEE